MKWIKSTIDEYMFHLRNETLDFELIHLADKIAFLGTTAKYFYRFMIPLEELPHNEDNVMVGI